MSKLKSSGLLLSILPLLVAGIGVGCGSEETMNPSLVVAPTPTSTPTAGCYDRGYPPFCYHSEDTPPLYMTVVAQAVTKVIAEHPEMFLKYQARVYLIERPERFMRYVVENIEAGPGRHRARADYCDPEHLIIVKVGDEFSESYELLRTSRVVITDYAATCNPAEF